jgi:hypothetical protein
MNPVAAIGAYAALCAELGLPFALPGESEALLELVDTDLLAAALAWSADAPTAAGQIFNITNGDVFVLRHAWPKLAEALGLAMGGTAPADFVSFFADPASQAGWSRIAAKHDLAEPSLDALLGQSHHYLDLLNGSRVGARPVPVLLSTIRLRQAGFADCRDSLSALIGQLDRMTQLRLLPPLLR